MDGEAIIDFGFDSSKAFLYFFSLCVENFAKTWLCGCRDRRCFLFLEKPHPHAARPRFQRGVSESLHGAAYIRTHGGIEEDPALCGWDS
jgi:hypothetical protein